MEPLNVGVGTMPVIALEKYAYQPTNFLGTWGAGRALLSIFVSFQGETTTVRITAHFAGFENNVSNSWIEWPTRGVMENLLLDRIAKDISVASPR